MTTYVALGDSISIDYYAGGPGRGAASLLVRNRDEDFPDWAGRDLTTRFPELRSELLVTDGATSQDVLDRQLPQLARLAEPPTFVTLTAGGNDLLQVYGDTPAARRVCRVVAANVREVLAAVRRLGGGDCVIAVGTVYDPSDGTGDAARLGIPPWPDGVAMIGELNAALTEVAREHGGAVAGIHELFLGHGVEAGSPAQPSPRPAERDLWYCGVIEPNAWGASAVRAAFWAALGLD
ncbi:MAG TPA: SGNH/GDSL hydrolase family protein [Mycobacteriales bacterium]|nr:SGNH/GDSL hydrolase family protein [Mycobacteriales bacterium]